MQWTKVDHLTAPIKRPAARSPPYDTAVLRRRHRLLIPARLEITLPPMSSTRTWDDELTSVRNQRAFLRDTRRMLDTVKKLRATHASGQASLETYPGRAGHGSMTKLENEGTSSELLRKARAFADPRTGYSVSELNRLIAHCEKEQFPLGPSFIHRLVAVKKGRARDNLQNRVIEGRWSRRQLDAEIARLLGNRRPKVGRKIKLPANADEAIYSINRLSVHMNHLLTEISKSPLLLPPSVKKQVSNTRSSLAALIRSISRSTARKQRTA